MATLLRRYNREVYDKAPRVETKCYRHGMVVYVPVFDEKDLYAGPAGFRTTEGVLIEGGAIPISYFLWPREGFPRR